MSLAVPYGLPALTVFPASAAVSFQDYFFGMSLTLPHGLPALTVFLAFAAV
jgi:hypothetical protein